MSEKPVKQTRRRPTLIEVGVCVIVGLILARIIYRLVHWRDVVEAIGSMSPVEWVGAVILGIGYCWLVNAGKHPRR